MGLRALLFPHLCLIQHRMSVQRAGCNSGRGGHVLLVLSRVCGAAAGLGRGTSVTKPCFPAEGSGLVKQTNSPRDPPFTSHQPPHPPLRLSLPVASRVAISSSAKSRS